MPSLLSGSQIVITGGNFHQSNITSKGPFERLLEATSPAAFHDSDSIYDPPKCHPNTRVAVLNKILDWIHGVDQETRAPLMTWLYGPAGSGKSAIARSIAELCAKEGILVASYFFSRFDSTRNHGRSIIATIAYQVSLCFPDARDRITRAIEHDPFIFTRSLDSQIFSLIIEPLQHRVGSGYFNITAPARVVIIDGLDECEDRNTQIKILDAISRSLQQHHFPFIFLIASRPEPDIRNAFGFGYLAQVSIRNPLDDDYLPSEDIHLFLRDKFTEIKRSHPFRAQIPHTWPSEDAFRTLVNKSSGQFIYPSTVIRFVKSTRHRPPQRLDIILGIRPAQHEMPFAELDALYMHTFLSVVNPEAVIRILALHLLSSYPCALSEMETLLSLDPGDIPVLLSDLTSLVSIEEDQSFDGPVNVLRVFHASLGDFLFDASRSKQFWINAPLRHAEFSVLHLKGRFSQCEEEYYLMMSEDVPGSMYRLNNLRAHFQNAAPTPELQETIAEFSVASHLAKLGTPGFIPYFFAVISQWNIDGAADLYNEQLRRFDHFAKGVLATMYAESSLTALISILQLEINNPSNLDILFVLFLIRKAHRSLDKLSFLYWVYISPDYRRFISEFLEDPRRSGIYAFTGKRHATAAVYFIKYIANHLEQITPTFSTLKRKYIQQRNTPWLWHKIVQKARSSEAAQIGRWQVVNRGLGWGSTIMLNSDRAFGLALRCLAHVLPRSERSDELTTLARRHTFGPLSRKYPYRKRALSREIARYLARVEQEGG